MTTIHLVQAAGGPSSLEWTITVHVGPDSYAFSLKSATGLDLDLPCDSMDFARSGFTPVTVTPDPRALVILDSEPVVIPGEMPLGEAALHGFFFALFSVLFLLAFK